ncbi:hypothetical protein CHS0354_014488 [Potamilus streckersoni]|uniref:RNA-polymerase II-associated protein 3-like C-terminal domain-containing protein n=1 Tax=Potamilus streckersoni TaxID=2493646 RepID=A0AAE0VS27_9BIVA|nr:hypothetical protein CHS0354_014488 [Potamilus streckersoni]
MSAGNLLVDSKTKRYNIPISHLDFGYIENCKDVQELEKILRILKSGEEGTYPDLERICEARVQALNPNSRTLRKEVPVLKPSDLPCEEKKDFDRDLTNWSQDIKDIDRNLKDSASKEEDEETDLPPIRNPVTLDSKGKKAEPSVSEDKSNKRVKPRDYQEWDKFDVEKELEKVDGGDNKSVSPISNQREKVSDHIDDKGLTNEEKMIKANREKDKGNEAFRANDYEEAVQYYSRSISLMPTIATYNNRALAYLKMEDWSNTLEDCNTVLKLEPDNIKALLRRGSAYKGNKDFDKARNDLRKVLKLEPNNKNAKELLKELDQAVVKEEQERKERKEKGRRMVIEEFDGSNLEEDKSDTQDHFESKADNLCSESEKTKSRRVLIEEISEGIEWHDTQALHGETCMKADWKENVRNVETEEAGHSQNIEHNKTPKEDEKSIWSDSEVGLILSEDQKVQSSESASDKPCVLENETDKRHQVFQELHTNIEADAIRDDIESTLCNSENKLTHFFDILKESKGSYDVEGSEQDNGDNFYTVKIDQGESNISQKDDIDQEAITDDKSVEQDSDGEIKNSEEESGPAIKRPVFIQSALPEEIGQLREAGNLLFRTGQYSEACSRYTEAIKMLEKEVSDQTLNLSLLYSNRAAAKLKMGELATAIQDCTCSLELVPHSVKPLLRRAQAYQMSERYNKAYVDYRHALILDSSIEQAHHGLTMCQNVLQQKDGPKWRDKLPKIPTVMPWEIPEILSEEQSKSLKEQLCVPQFFAGSQCDVKDASSKTVPSHIVNKDQSGEWQEPPTVPTTLTHIINKDQSGEWQEPPTVPTTLTHIVNKDQSGEWQEPPTVPTTLTHIVNKDQSGEWQEPPRVSTTASQIVHTEQPREQDEPLTAPIIQPQKKIKEKTFEDLKAEGNDYVKEGKFRDAIKCYTECIGLSPYESVSFTNRALCYLRINEPSSAEKDCDQALNLDSKNIKALFRRAQAKKMLQRYKESLKDLKHLLKIDPQNTAAKKEMDLVKDYWRQDLEKIREQMPGGTTPKPQSASSSSLNKAGTKSTTKQRKRINIEEEEEEGSQKKGHSKQNISGSGDSETRQFRRQYQKADKKKATTVHQSRSHVENQPKVQPKIHKEAAAQKPKPSSGSSKTSSGTKPSEANPQKSKTQEQKTKSTVKQTSVGLPKVVPSVLKLEKTTPYEFISAWNNLKSAESLQPYYELLKQVPPEEIPNVVSNKLDDKMLTTITRCVHDHFIKDGEDDTGFKILQHLCKVPRFQTVAMFMTLKEKSVVKSILQILGSRESAVYTQEDLTKIKQAFEL